MFTKLRGSRKGVSRVNCGQNLHCPLGQQCTTLVRGITPFLLYVPLPFLELLLVAVLGKLPTSENPMPNWFYYDNGGQKQGPVTGGQLKGLAKAGQITPETIVETEEGKTAPAGKVQGLTFAETAKPEELDTFAFPCPNCTKTLQAKKRAAGKTKECPACKMSFTVPTVDTNAFNAVVNEVMDNPVPSPAVSTPPAPVSPFDTFNAAMSNPTASPTSADSFDAIFNEAMSDTVAPPLTAPPSSVRNSASNYFYIGTDGVTRGPIDERQLKSLAGAGIITPTTQLETTDGNKRLAKEVHNLFDSESPLVPSASSQEHTPQRTSGGGVVAQSSNGRLAVFTMPTVYIPKNAGNEWCLGTVMFDGKNGADTEGLFNVNGRPEALRLSSTDNDIAKVSTQNGLIIVNSKKPGRATITVTVGSESVQKAIDVIELPVNVAHMQNKMSSNGTVILGVDFHGGNTIQEIIKLLGFPDTQESINVSYPKEIRKDCVFYRPVFDRKQEFGNGNVSAIHYHYDSKYPGLVVTFVDGRVRRLSLKPRIIPWAGTTIGEVPARLLGHYARSFSEGAGCAAPAAAFIITAVLYLLYSCVG